MTVWIARHLCIVSTCIGIIATCTRPASFNAAQLDDAVYQTHVIQDASEQNQVQVKLPC